MTSEILASDWSFTGSSGTSSLQKNMRAGYGWTFGNQHLGYTIKLTLLSKLTTASGELLGSRYQWFEQIRGDLSNFLITASYRTDARWLPVSYDVNTMQYHCISAETNQTEEIDDNSRLHPLFKVVDPIHEVSPNLA